ncbi:Polyadenylate-binding protein 2 [Acorus calamus]|uniref:Eukaryotic translation initiation factor 3 subunit G n=1 Tax=Acorus calamus TaxID=4465 RepID=A0AAV9F3C3_ACOCL|nr:Polyadenylate-binding protein 2 [Acorus calamus]
MAAVMAETKVRWGELEEDDGDGLEFLLPPKVVEGPDENGVKRTIEYKFDGDGNKVRVTTTTRVRKLARARLSRRAVERRSWPKFGDAAREDAGSRLTMVSTEEILIEKPRAPGRQHAPNRDHRGPGCSWQEHVRSPRHESWRGERTGTEMRRRNENSVRVTNLSEDTREPDLLELFRTFGAVSRVYVAVDQKTGMSRGFGFVNFVNKDDAERAINKLNGYGYDNLILRFCFQRQVDDVHCILVYFGVIYSEKREESAEMVMETMRSSKMRWEEMDDDDWDALYSLLPSTTVDGPDENGVKRTTEHRLNEVGNRVRVTTVTRVRKVGCASLGCRAVERRSWPKIGDAAVEGNGGSWLTVVSAEEVFLERPRKSGTKVTEPQAAGDPLRALRTEGAVLTMCRTCGKKGEHWTSRCPYRNLAIQSNNTTEMVAPAAANTNKYIPPGITGGGGGEGARTGMRRWDSLYTVRVSNLSEDTQDSDLLDLFRPFGAIVDAHITLDRRTGRRRDYGHVRFVNKEDAEKAINSLNGYGYDNLILRVNWAPPRLN